MQECRFELEIINNNNLRKQPGGAVRALQAQEFQPCPKPSWISSVYSIIHSPEFISLITLKNGELTCLQLVGILNLVGQNENYWFTCYFKLLQDKCNQGPKIFTSLSSEIHNASSTALFNSKLKSFFLGISTL